MPAGINRLPVRLTIGKFFFAAPFDDGGGQDVGARTGASVASAVEPVGDVADPGTAPLLFN